MAEPCPTSNWQSGPPLIGPRRSEVDPFRTFGFLQSGRAFTGCRPGHRTQTGARNAPDHYCRRAHFTILRYQPATSSRRLNCLPTSPKSVPAAHPQT